MAWDSVHRSKRFANPDASVVVRSFDRESRSEIHAERSEVICAIAPGVRTWVCLHQSKALSR